MDQKDSSNVLRAEIQWDYICLTVLAIATAALAGVFFVLEIGDQGGSSHAMSSWSLPTTTTPRLVRYDKCYRCLELMRLRLIDGDLA